MLKAARWLLILLILSNFIMSCGKSESHNSNSSEETQSYIVDEFDRHWRSHMGKLDVIFVVDNSRSMGELQKQIAKITRDIVREITIAPDYWYSVPVEDAHFGVITSDMGAGGSNIETCTSSDDGIMAGESFERCHISASTNCPGGQCFWLKHQNALTEDGCQQAHFSCSEDVPCLTSVGAEGCGFSQPLEALTKALTVHMQPGGVHEGFLRPDGRLLIIFITDGDDCSVGDAEFFDPERMGSGSQDSTQYCRDNSEMLHPVEEYAKILLSLVPALTSSIDIFVIGGFPSVWQGNLLDNLAEHIARQEAVCHYTGESSVDVHPSLRLAQLVSLVNTNSSIESRLTTICEDIPMDFFDSYLHNFILPGQSWFAPCPMRPYGEPDGCSFVEILPDDRPCPHLAEAPTRSCGPGWHRDRGLDEQGKRKCEILSADRNGDGSTDLIPKSHLNLCQYGNERMQNGCLPGWIVNKNHSNGDGWPVDFNIEAASMMSPLSTIRLECQLGPSCIDSIYTE